MNCDVQSLEFLNTVLDAAKQQRASEAVSSIDKIQEGSHSRSILVTTSRIEGSVLSSSRRSYVPWTFSPERRALAGLTASSGAEAALLSNQLGKCLNDLGEAGIVVGKKRQQTNRLSLGATAQRVRSQGVVQCLP